MATRVIGPIDCSAGLVQRAVIAAGDVIGTLTVAQAPAGSVLSVQLGNQPGIPMEVGDTLDRLTAEDGRYGIFITLPPTTGFLTLFAGVAE